MKYTITALLLLSAIFSMGQDTILHKGIPKGTYTVNVIGSPFSANAAITAPTYFEKSVDTSIGTLIVGITPLAGSLYFKPYQEPAWHSWAIILGVMIGVPFLTLAGLALCIYIFIRRQEKEDERVRKVIQSLPVIVCLLISGMAMGQTTAPPDGSGGSYDYKQTRRLDSISAALTQLKGAIFGNNGWLEMMNAYRNFSIGEIRDLQKRVDSLEILTTVMDCEIFNRQHVLAYNNIQALQNDMADMSLHNFILNMRLDSLIKAVRDRPSIRWELIGEGTPPSLLPVMHGGYDSGLRFYSPHSFYSSPAGDTLYQFGRDRSFTSPYDPYMAIDPPVDTAMVAGSWTLRRDVGNVIVRTHKKKKTAAKKKKPLYTIGTQDQGLPAGVSLDTLSSRNGMQIFRIHPPKPKTW